MPGHVKVNNAVNMVGDDVSCCADRIRTAGEEMFTHLRGLVDSGQLTGEGIERELTLAHGRWDAACNQFAEAESRFAEQCYNTYTNTMANDLRCGSYLSAA